MSHGNPNKPVACTYDATTRTLQPSVTGSIILGLRYEDGVILACDTMGSYGGLRKYKDINRIITVNENCMLAASGDVADFIELERMIEEQVRSDEVCADHGVQFNAKSLHAFIQTVFYGRRTKQNPFWLTVAVGGFEGKNKSKPFLGVVDSLGVSWEAPHVTTGFGGMIAGPFLELKTQYGDNEAGEANTSDNLSREKALEMVKRGLSVVNYRDKMTINSWNVGEVSKTVGAKLISQNEELPTNWKLAHLIVGYE